MGGRYFLKNVSIFLGLQLPQLALILVFTTGKSFPILGHQIDLKWESPPTLRLILIQPFVTTSSDMPITVSVNYATIQFLLFLALSMGKG
jgi:hypothetical protein